MPGIAAVHGIMRSPVRLRPYLDLLRHNPAFTRLYGAQLISFAGDWFATVATINPVWAFGPYRADLRFTDFSKEALATRFLPWSQAYLQLCVDGWAREVAKRYGAETMAQIEWAAWNDLVVPEIARMKQQFLPAGTVYEDPNREVPENERVTTRVTYTGLFTRDSSTVELSKPEIVTWLLGSHE